MLFVVSADGDTLSPLVGMAGPRKKKGGVKGVGGRGTWDIAAVLVCSTRC